ncbi:hypothetical protein ABT202_26345 [Streptomyces sp900105245]|uniref:hypothetical protein n=1 Tax=Streptomyces sp. 900105245 TaxID=3154379 RepID=UPI0033271645
MLTEQAQRALILLDHRARKTGDLFALDRVDRAKDEIIRLNASAPAAFQVRSAWAHAGAVLRERKTLVPAVRLSDVAPQDEPGGEDVSFAAVELREWLRTTPSLAELQRQLLQNLATGMESDTLAPRLGVPLPRMRQQISRARKIARSAYAVEVATA